MTRHDPAGVPAPVGNYAQGVEVTPGTRRRERLGAVRPALTVVIAQTFAPEWLLEIEAVAAA